MTPQEKALLASLDEAVSEGLALGYSQRAIAEELNVTRDRVARSVRRLERAKAPPAAPATIATDMGALLESIDREIETCLTHGDAQGAGRWSRARSTLLESESKRRAAEAAAPKEAPPSTEDWTRLDDFECGVLCALTRKLNGEPQASGDAKALARFSQPPTPIESCGLCASGAATRKHYVCPECLSLAQRARSGLPLVGPGEKLLGAAP